jgi:hypothetical protein
MSYLIQFAIAKIPAFTFLSFCGENNLFYAVFYLYKKKSRYKIVLGKLGIDFR